MDEIRTCEIREWLKGVGFEQYADSFIANDVDCSVLATLTRDDLTDLGVTSVGHRRRILDAISAMSEAAEVELQEAKDTTRLVSRTSRATVEPTAFLGVAERRNLTIMMCDLASSTELASRHDPEEIRDVIEAFQNIASGAIVRFGGYVAKFMGDGILAYFGYPNALENDAEYALRAGIAILERMAPVKDPDDEPVLARVGVATGLVVVGDLVGEGSARERAVVGDAPSMAERLQRLGEPGTVLCSATTRQLAADHFHYKDLGLHRLKGFDAPVQVWQVTGERVIESRFAATRLTNIGPLVGRVQELALLHERWQAVLGGEGQVVLLTGDPGIGKSRLVRDFAEELGDSDLYRIAMQCSPHFRDSAFLPAIRELEISAGFAQSDTLKEKRDKLGRLFADIPNADRYLGEFATLLALGDEAGVGGAAAPDTLRRRFMEALIGRVETTSRQLPVLVVFEDAHWMDPSTREFMTGLMNRLERLRVLVVVTYRQEFDCPWTDHAATTLLKLSRLTRYHSRVLVHELVGGALSDDLIDEVVERTDGVPLFLEEVSRALIEANAVMPDGDATSGTAKGGAKFAVPATLNDTLLSRLDRDMHAKHVAQIASVIGREFRYSLLAAIAPLEEGELRAGIDRLLAAGLIVRQPGLTEEIFAFKHNLLHQATYDTVLLRTREGLHLAIARALEEEFRDIGEQRPEVVALHYCNAGEIEPAAELWLKAGRLALTRGAYDEAKHQLHLGLEALEELTGPGARLDIELDLQIALADTLRSARLTGGDEALAVCRRARELSDQLGDVEKLVRALGLEFGINFNRPNLAASRAVADTFLSVGEKHGNKVALALGRQCRGSVAFTEGDLEAARTEFEIGFRHRDPAREREIVTQYQFPTNSLIYSALANFLLGDCETARLQFKEAIELAARSSTFALSLTLANGLILLRLMRAEDEAKEPLENLREIAGARGAPFWVDLVGFHDGWDLVQAGEFDVGLPKMERAIETFSSNAVEIEVPFYEALIAEAQVVAGKYDQALVYANDALARVSRTGEKWCLPELYRVRALALQARDPPMAHADLELAKSTAEAQGIIIWQLRVAVTGYALATSKREHHRLAGDIAGILARTRGGEGLPDFEYARTICSALSNVS